MSPTNGQITYALLTRPPLGIATSFDLHVLSTPPAFVLSQDQTLNLKSCFKINFWLHEIFISCEINSLLAKEACCASFDAVISFTRNYCKVRSLFPLFNFQGPFCRLSDFLYSIMSLRLCQLFFLHSLERFIILSCLFYYVNIFCFYTFGHRSDLLILSQ